jgi:hypothetical protein
MITAIEAILVFSFVTWFGVILLASRLPSRVEHKNNYRITTLTIYDLTTFQDSYYWLLKFYRINRFRK